MPQLLVLSVPLFTLTQQSTMERETLKLNQRLMLSMDTMDTETTDTLPTVHMPTDHMLMEHGDMARDLLMLSQRLMLSMESMDTVLTDHMPMEPTDHMLTPPDGDMARDLLMLKPRLTQLSSTPPVLSTLQFTPSSAPHSCLP